MILLERNRSIILNKWLKEAKIQSDPDTLFYLIGNQADNEDWRAVPRQRAEEFKAKMKLDGFYETSALNGQNVEKAFVDGATKLYRMNTSAEDLAMMPKMTKNNGSSVSTASSKSNNKEFTKLSVERHSRKADDQHKKKKSGWC